MANLTTAADIIARAFTRNLSTSRIQDDVIDACQTKYIKPVLGDDFYTTLIASPTSYTTLINTYIKPVLSWWVRYMILPELRTELSDLGILTIQVKDAANASDELFAEVRDNTRIVAEEKTKLLTEYLNANLTLYPLYNKGTNPDDSVEIIGGILTRKTKQIDQDDPRQWMYNN